MEDITKQVGYYDARWSSFSYANLYSLERCVFFLQSLLELQLEEPKICDFGCGAGWLTGILSNFGATLGVDLSPRAIELARVLYPKAMFICADGTNWTPETDRFDVVVSQEVIEHIDDKLAYLATIHLSLKNRGYLLMTTPNLDVLNAIPNSERKAIWEIQPVELPLKRAELNALLKQADFRVLKTGSVVTGCGKLGRQRLLNSHKLSKLLSMLGASNMWRSYLRKAGYGMYLTTVAQKLTVTPTQRPPAAT